MNSENSLMFLSPLLGLKNPAFPRKTTELTKMLQSLVIAQNKLRNQSSINLKTAPRIN